MTFDDLASDAIDQAVRGALAGGSRDALWTALLAEPLGMPQVGLGAKTPTTVRLAIDGPPVPLVDAETLRMPVVPLYARKEALAAAATERKWWPDKRPRVTVQGEAGLFALLRGHPGALVVADAAHAVALDAGELAALADKQAPPAYAAALRALVEAGKGGEAARRLAGHPLYVLGHPRGGMLLLQRELPVFLHLAEAEAFAERLARTTGERPQHGLVAATDLFSHAWKGKLTVRVSPGPLGFALKTVALRQ